MAASRPKAVLSREQWQKQKRERADALRKQSEGFESSEIFKLSVEAKLKEAGACGRWWQNFNRCGRERVFLMCAGCREIEERKYQCNLKWCPCCNWRITDRRTKLLTKITAGITNTKHVVLTQKNFVDLTAAKIRTARANLLRLRRQKICGRVDGGTASLEFTNEGNGWHMHWHLLLVTPYIDAKALSIRWGELVGQEFAIVKVMDVSERSYLKEVCKYVVTGSELAKWAPEQILQFVTALQGTRLFTVFGRFVQIRKHAALLIKREQTPRMCACGCSAKIVGPSVEIVERAWMKQF